MTNPTRSLLLSTAAAAGLAVLAGCASPSDDDLLALAPPPAEDEATDLREWPVVVAEYESGNVVAGSTVFWLETDPDELNEVGEAALEPLVFAANVVTTPVALFLPPPWEAVEHDSMSLPPSYTAAVRLGERETVVVPEPPAPAVEDVPDDATPDLVPQADIDAAGAEPEAAPATRPSPAPTPPPSPTPTPESAPEPVVPPVVRDAPGVPAEVERPSQAEPLYKGVPAERAERRPSATIRPATRPSTRPATPPAQFK